MKGIFLELWNKGSDLINLHRARVKVQPHKKKQQLKEAAVGNRESNNFQMSVSHRFDAVIANKGCKTKK